MQVLPEKYQVSFHLTDRKKFAMKAGMLTALISYPFAKGIFYLGLTAALIGWVFYLREKENILSYLLEIPLIKEAGLILLFSAVSMLYSENLGYAFRYWNMIFQAIVSYMILYETLDSWQLVKLFCYSLMGAGTIISIFALYEYGAGIEDRRAVSVFTNPNLLATYLLIIAPLVLAQISGAAISLKKRFILIAFFAASYTALILTMSRGAWLGITAAVAGIIVMTRNFRLLLVILLVTVLILPLGSENFYGRLTSIADMEEHTGRLNIWQGTVNMIRDNPVFGVGIGNFRPMYENYAPEDASPGMHHTHNILLQTLAEIGIFGLLLSLVFLRSLAKYIGRLFKKVGGNKKIMIIGITASLIGLFVHQQVDVTLHDRGIAFYAMFMLALPGYFYRNQRKEETGEIK